MLPAFEITSSRVLFAEELDRGCGDLPRHTVIVLQGNCHPGQVPRIRCGAGPHPSVQLSCPVCDRPIIALALAKPLPIAEGTDLEIGDCSCGVSRVAGYVIGAALLAILCPQCQRVLHQLSLQQGSNPEQPTLPAVRPADILDVFDHWKRANASRRRQKPAD